MSIIWKGPEREIPGYCMAKPGEPLPDSIPESMVQSYIDQGLAKKETAKTVKLKED